MSKENNILRIAVACDHGGYPLKRTVVDVVEGMGYEGLDLGTDSTASVDYPDFALKIGRALQNKEAERGILICGSGIGASIAANKIRGVYAGVCHDTYSAHQGVEHDRMNVLCLGARVIGPEIAREIVKAFLGAEFMPEERHLRRTEKIRQIENDSGLI